MKNADSTQLVHTLDLTKELMTFHSTADNKEALTDALKLVKKELKGFAIEEFESNGVKSLLAHNAKPGTKNFKIILNAHLDVVHAQKNQFKVVEKNGKLYGRGSYDMKAAASVMVDVFKKVAATVSYPLALQVVTDEEIGGFNGTDYQVKQGLRADFVITGDCGSDLNIVNEAKGIMWVKLHTQGTKAHGAYLWRGDNALWKLHKDLSALHHIFPVPSEEDWVTTMNLAKIETGNTNFNHVPEGATAYLDFRFVPEDEKDLMSKIIKAVSPETEIDVQFCDSPEFVEENNVYVQHLQQATRAITKHKADFKRAHAPSDIRHYNKAGLQGVGFGPIGEHQHGEEEWVDIQSLEDYYKILEHFLRSLK